MNYIYIAHFSYGYVQVRFLQRNIFFLYMQQFTSSFVQVPTVRMLGHLKILTIGKPIKGGKQNYTVCSIFMASSTLIFHISHFLKLLSERMNNAK